MSLEKITEAVVGLFLIAIFVTALLPELAKITNQSMNVFYLAFLALAIAIIFSVFQR